MIDVQGLTKEYGRLRAVDNLSFRVEPGQVLGFLGPNGAGKTTTMRIVAGFLPATSGRVLVCGHDIETQSVAAKRRIGYLPEGAPSYPEMTPRSFLEFIAEARDKIIVISTHLLEEVDAVCNRAIIIAHGKILADDTPRGLETRSRFHNAVSVKLATPEHLAAARRAINALSEVASTELDEKTQRLTAFPAPGKLPLAAINALAEKERWHLAELHLESGRMDEVFRSITGGAMA